MHSHCTKYTFGDSVYLKTDPDQHKRMVIAFTLRPGGIAYYEIAFGSESSFHFEIEMSDTPDQALQLGLKEAAEK
jgi:hypothetical protein